MHEYSKREAITFFSLEIKISAIFHTGHGLWPGRRVRWGPSRRSCLVRRASCGAGVRLDGQKLVDIVALRMSALDFLS